MSSKQVGSKQLGALLEAFAQAEIKPFDALSSMEDIFWFASEMRNLCRGWDSAIFVGNFDPHQNFTQEITEGIAKAAYVLGAGVWYTNQGYFGNPDYLISWKPKDLLFASEDLEDYDPADFKLVKWTDADLYE